MFVVAVVKAKRRLEGKCVLKPNQLPADLVVVTAVFRVSKEPHDGMLPDLLEEFCFLNGDEELDCCAEVRLEN